MVVNLSEDARCGHCALQLHQCGGCRGMAGPFDRYCGFCGHELVRGTARPLWWRLWFLLLLAPLIAGLIYGIVQAQSHR